MGEWFFPLDSLERRKFIKQTYQGADALLIGRTTYEMLAPYWAGLPDDENDGLAGVLRHMPKYVVSDGAIVAEWGDTTILKGDIEAMIKKLKHEVGNIMIIGSSALAESLAEAGLMDEYMLFVQPFIMGSGKTFFRKGMKTPVELVEVKKLNQGILFLHYQVKK